MDIFKKVLVFSFLAVCATCGAQMGGGGGSGWTLYNSSYVDYPRYDINVNSWTNTSFADVFVNISDFGGDNYCTGDSPSFEPSWGSDLGIIYGVAPDPLDPVTLAFINVDVPAGGTISLTVTWSDVIASQTWLYSDGETQASREASVWTTTYAHLNESW